MNDAKARILGRLRSAPRGQAAPLPAWSPPTYGAGRVEQFTRMLQASHAEVYRVPADAWQSRLASVLAEKGVRTLLIAPATAAGHTLVEAWAGEDGVPTLIPYDHPIEEMKPVLVNDVDAALTTTVGGIAETGTLVLWPSPDEPRLMSLLPPIHIALVESGKVADNLAQVMADGGWAGRMPTNVVLISGPSKTADIEQTLAYGVHGPKELIVLILDPVGGGSG